MHLDVDLLIGVLLPNCFLSLSLVILTSSVSASTRLFVVTALLPRPPLLGRVSGLDSSMIFQLLQFQTVVPVYVGCPL